MKATINTQNGELVVELDGQRYTLALTLNAMAWLEDKHQATFDEVTAKAQAGSMTALREFFWVLFQKHHPDVTLEQAGGLVTLGRLNEIIQKVLSDVVTASQPDPKDVKEIVGKGKKENPTNARASADGTGASSTSPLAASV